MANALMRQVRKTFPTFCKGSETIHDNYAPDFLGPRLALSSRDGPRREGMGRAVWAARSGTVVIGAGLRPHRRGAARRAANRKV